MCWRAGSAGEYEAGRDELAAHADRHPGGLVVLDGSAGAPNLLNSPGVLAGAYSAVLTTLRTRMDKARRDGLAPWVLVPMERLASPDAPAARIVAMELELAELAADGDTGVVCAYRGPLWRSAFLADIAAVFMAAIAAVHSRVVGIRAGTSGFRLRSTGARGYALESVVGFESLRSFTVALRGALLRTPLLRLGCGCCTWFTRTGAQQHLDGTLAYIEKARAEGAAVVVAAPAEHRESLDAHVRADDKVTFMDAAVLGRDPA